MEKTNYFAQFFQTICTKRLVIVFSLLFCLMYTPGIQADTEDIVLKGKVFNKDKEPMVGATVTVNKHKGGVVVDIDGNYSLRVPSIKFPCTLTVQYIGYKTERVTINNYREGRNTKIILEEDNYSLDDVVVVGYGKSSRKKLTGSVAKVTSTVITKSTQEAPVMALQGNASGVYIEQSSGVPGAGGNNVVIRGISTLTSQTQPLYIVDGIPFNATGKNPVGSTWNGIFGLPDALSFINPGDIESMEILKDADATAIYGTRGANGVILITTKKGQSGRMRVNAKYSATASYVAKRMDFLSTEEYLDLRRRTYESDLAKGYLDESDFNEVNFPDLLLWDQKVDYDLQDELIGNTAWAHDAQLQVSGGNNNTSYMISGSYYNSNTVTMSDDTYSRWSVHSNLNYTSTNKRFMLESGVNFSGINTHAQGGDSPYTSLISAPNTPLFDEEGNPYYIPGDADFSSPTSFMNYDGDQAAANFLGNLSASYRIIDNLKAKVSLGYNYSSSDQSNKYGSYFSNPYNRRSVNRANYSKMSTNTFLIEPQISYDRQVLKGKMSALLGATYQATSYSILSMSGEKYPNDAFLGNINAASIISRNSNIRKQSKTASVFARLTYDWDSRYLLNAIYRRDGSSRFGPDNRWGNFYSIGAAWLFSNEKFIKETGLGKVISHGKLRASYGRTGNDGIEDYAYLTKYSTSRSPYEGNIGMQPDNLADPGLHWETTNKLDLGLELGLFNDRALLNVTWFRNISTDLLTNTNMAGQTGFSSIKSNLDAEIENRGWEIELNTQNIKTDNFLWTTSFNITIPHNKLLSFKDLESSAYSFDYEIGKSVNIIRGYNFLGIDNQTGLPKFEDLKNPESLSRVDDYQALGSLDPQCYGGLNNAFTYKGFTFDFTFYFRKKEMDYGYLRQYWFPIGTMHNVPKEMAENAWTTPGVDAKYPGLCSTPANPIYSQYQRYYQRSQAGYSNASYVRLKDVTLAYNFPHKWLTPMNISALRLYLQAKNLFTITNYNSYDPETVQAVPALTSWTLGFNLTF